MNVYTVPSADAQGGREYHSKTLLNILTTVQIVVRKWRVKMGDLISRQAVIEAIDNHIFYDDYDSIDKTDLINAIEVLPSAEKCGQWIVAEDIGDCCYRCSNCGFIRDAYVLDIGKYCPNCGAKMYDLCGD